MAVSPVQSSVYCPLVGLFRQATNLTAIAAVASAEETSHQSSLCPQKEITAELPLHFPSSVPLYTIRLIEDHRINVAVVVDVVLDVNVNVNGATVLEVDQREAARVHWESFTFEFTPAHCPGLDERAVGPAS
jgi:hypothetical protein